MNGLADERVHLRLDRYGVLGKAQHPILPRMNLGIVARKQHSLKGGTLTAKECPYIEMLL